jgi:molybdopterin-guanine dinucleotide biosynthesis protein
VGGDAATPGSETTKARTATERHVVYTNDYYDWIVTCSDDLGNHYTGIFPND